MRFPFRIALYVFHLIPIIGPMGGWVGPEGNRWEFAPSGTAAAEPSIRGTSSWLKKNDFGFNLCLNVVWWELAMVVLLLAAYALAPVLCVVAGAGRTQV